MAASSLHVHNLLGGPCTALLNVVLTVPQELLVSRSYRSLRVHSSHCGHLNNLEACLTHLSPTASCPQARIQWISTQNNPTPLSPRAPRPPTSSTSSQDTASQVEYRDKNLQYIRKHARAGSHGFSAQRYTTRGFTDSLWVLCPRQL